MRPGDASILKTNSTGAPRTGIKGQAGRCDPDLATSQPRPSELFRLLYHSRRDHRALTWRQYFSQARAVLLVGRGRALDFSHDASVFRTTDSSFLSLEAKQALFFGCDPAQSRFGNGSQHRDRRSRISTY